MAQKRMFDKKVVESDKFIDLPNSSKALYFMAGMDADDKGFFQPRKLQKVCGFSDDDFKILIAKGFFITFESGVMVVTDWNKNNWLDSRRITETEYVDELNLLKLINQRYEFKDQNESAKRVLSENSIDKNRIEKKSNISKDILPKENVQKVYFASIELNNLFLEFLDLRLKLKCKNTDKAITLLVNELNKYDDNTKIEMINESIMNSWKSVYPPKQFRQNKKGKFDAVDKVIREVYDGTIRFQ